jgi:hypothetical protein
MRIIVGFFIFCLVLFFYLHIQFHLKTGEDLEMYEVDQPSKDRLEEICDLRQPVLFDFECQKIMDTTNRNYISNNYSAFELKIRNVKETDENTELYMPLPMNASIKLFNEDNTSSYFTENNGDFLEETGVGKNMRYNDEFLRPYMVSNCNYDVLIGSSGTCTPFRYEINYRNYFLLTQGSAQIKLSPPHSKKYLYPNYDYENFEFSSPVNPWSPQPKYAGDFDKIKCLEFTLLPGKTLYIPAFWWYSIKFHSNTSISCFNYRTYMNNFAILPYVGMHALQMQNVKRVVVKTVNINELNKMNNVNNSDTSESIQTSSQHADATSKEQTAQIEDQPQITATNNVESTNITDLPEPSSLNEELVGSTLD